MRSVLLSLLLIPALLHGSEEQGIGSYLGEPSYQLDLLLRGKPEPYLPQPGDIMLATDDNKFWKITHNLALAGEPHNSAIIVARPDGSLAVLEAGANDTLRVHLLDMLPHLKAYANKGPVWIRKRRVPLTPEQCTQLTDFAMRAHGKRFALVRLGGQLTVFRSRGPLRTYFVGRSHGDRANYFCSELVTEACVAAGLLDPARTRPAATYPHDLFFDTSLNHFIRNNYRLQDCWYPPARWVCEPWDVADCHKK